MTDLFAQIRAAIDEDERLAQAACQENWRWYAEDKGVVTGDDQYRYIGLRADSEHMARHDPARVKRQAEFHRKILAQHDGIHRCDWGDYAGGELPPCVALLDLAAVYEIEYDGG